MKMIPQTKKVVSLQNHKKIEKRCNYNYHIFSEQTKYINSTLGLFEKEGNVYYLHNGSPIYCHEKDDRSGYRFIVGNLICNKLCTVSDFRV